MFVPQVVGVTLNVPRDLAHLGQGCWLLVIVDVALEHFQHIDPVPGVGDESREQDVEPVVDRDEFIPVSNRPA